MTMRKPLPLLLVALLAGCWIEGGVAPHVEVGERPYQKLTWDDYQLIDSSRDGMSAGTSTFFGWTYSWTPTLSGGGYSARLTSITIESGIDREKSWRVRDLGQGGLDLLLVHEQLHFDINEIQARKLRGMGLEEWGTGFGPTPDAAGADLTAKVEGIAKAALDEAQRLGDQYDTETAHGTNAEAQQRWAREIDAQFDPS